MRLIDADEAKKKINQMQTLKASERNLLRLAVDRTPTYEPPNDPLILKQLREMDGEPVWIFYFAGGSAVCMLVDAKHDVCRDAHGGFAVFENLGITWMAYHRKPEEASISSDEGPEPQRGNEPWKDFLSHRFERKE